MIYFFSFKLIYKSSIRYDTFTIIARISQMLTYDLVYVLLKKLYMDMI